MINIIDLSDEIVLNNNANNLNINYNNTNIKTINKISPDKNNGNGRKLSQIFTINQDDFKDKQLIYFYLFPFWVLKRSKAFKSVYLIKDKICTYFSIEKLNELIKFKENFERKKTFYKANNNVEFTFNKKFQNNNDFNEMKK